MEKDKFLKIVFLYKKENNITRLVYRLIKYEYEENLENKHKWLSKSDIWRISQKIIFTPNNIERNQSGTFSHLFLGGGSPLFYFVRNKLILPLIYGSIFYLML